MTTDIQRQTPMKFLLAVIGLTASAMFVTATIGYLVTEPPRGFMWWIGVGFLCTIEFLAGILTVNIFARARCQYRPSGATLAITYGIVGAFAASGLLSILIYSIVRDKEGTKDGVFTAVLMAITAVWFIVAFLLYAYDLHRQAIARPSQEKRAEHQGYSRSLVPILSAIRALKTDNNERRTRLAIIAKKLEKLCGSLAHSHGGGTGSWETGQSHPVAPEQDQEIRENIEGIGRITHQITTGESTDIDSAMTQIEQGVTRISSAVNTLGLS